MHKKLLFICLAMLALCSLVNFTDNTDYWIVDILSHFPVQYALASLFLMAVCIWKKHLPFAAAAGLLLFINAGTVIDLDESIHAAGHASTTFKIYSANIYKDNRELSELNREIQKIDPDIVLLLEVTPKHREKLHPIVLTYPYRIENIFKGDLGFVFLSKFPVHDHRITKLSSYGNSLLEAMLEINQKSVMFYGLHAQRPDRGDFNERKRQFFEPARRIREQSLPVIVAGDFNTTPYSPIFRKFVRLSGLRDSREGFRWQPSWPALFPPLWLP
ncbi:MAG: endonuclease/exonuclease/phosphatase family protein, partial [Thermodesulfovibrionia bacterium]|nr:endonuclease/exonuclease/phosphatase family protein [Thermodesulfovibrionia bacterium]